VRVSPRFTPSPNEVDRLLAAHPFALVVSVGDNGFCVTPLPLLLQRSEGEAVLLGHFARNNPHVQELERQPAAVAIFMGPRGYISPSWLSDRTHPPAFHHATVLMQVRVDFDWSADAARQAVELLTSKMEAGRRNAWSPEEMGSRYAQLLPGVVAFRAPILETTAVFKLGQNEPARVLTEALAGLASEQAHELHAMMQRANAHRSESGASKG